MLTSKQANVMAALIRQAVIDQDESWLDTASQYLHQVTNDERDIDLFQFWIDQTREHIQRAA